MLLLMQIQLNCVVRNFMVLCFYVASAAYSGGMSFISGAKSGASLGAPSEDDICIHKKYN